MRLGESANPRRFLAVAVLLAAGQSEASPGPVPGQRRTYFIAAEEVAWDYAPSGRNLVTGRPFDEQQKVFVERGPARIGRVYRKALYREYTDSSFTTRKAVPSAWAHLGMLGPALRGSVGDTIVVVFRNHTALPFSVHPHGVFYAKDAEGAPYADGDAASADDAVPPGGTYIYRWPVPERAGPGPADGSSVLWMYHSHANESKDINSGLIGPIIITRPEATRSDGTPADVDREFVLLFMVDDENDSWYLEANARTLPLNATPIDPTDPDFIESNLKHSINGFVYGNLPMPTMRIGERVRWYLMALGTEVDLHTPHWHGQAGTFMGMRTDMVELLPGSMKMLDTVLDNPGIWLLHCHVNDHTKAGMLARFEVLPRLAATDAAARPDPN